MELTETGTGGDGYNSTIFGWGSISSLYQTKDIESAFNADSSYILTGDFNGDGLADLFTYPRKTGPYSSEDKWRIYSGGQNEYEFLAQGDLTSDFKGFIIADGDGDGDDDFYQKIQNQSVSVSFLFYKLAADSLLRDANYDFTRALDGFMDINMLPADFNGDGFDDIMFVYANNNIEGFENIDVQSTPLLNAPDRILMLDFNGDGKTDIATIKYDPLGLADTLNVIRLNSNTGNFESYLQDFISDGLDNISTGDFNGDRKTDFLLRNDNNDYVTTKILFSTGSGIIEKNCPITANLTTGVYQDSTVTKSLDLIVNDFNLDGKADIMKSLTSTTRTMGIPVNVSSSVFQEIYLSYGTGFVVETVYNGQGSRVFGQADCDGDGNQDFILTINGEGNTAIEYLTDYQRDLLTSITDGKNTRVEFTYKSLMDASVYNREPEEYDPPVFSMAYPVKLLSGIKTYNNNNQALIEESVFSYTNLKHHRQGKGNLGFSKITAENLTNGSKTVSSCSYDTLYFVPYTSGIEKYMNNNPVSEATNVFSYKTFDGGTRFLPYSSQSTNTDLLNNVSTGNTVILDDEGNLTRQETDYLDGSQTVVKETVSEFSGYNSFGKPTGISVTNTRNGESVTRSKTVTYDQITGLPLSETAAFGSSPSVVTTYSYDDFGNQESLSVTSGSKTRTGENIWEQGKGRFMAGKVNALGDTVSYSYDKTGSVISSTDISGLVTSYTYDGLGNIETTTLPGDRVIQSSLAWSQNSTGKGDLYYRRTESTGKPTTVEYFDISGRSIRSKTQGFDGTYLVTETEFDSLGRTIRSYDPFFEGSTATRYTGYQYDDYNRIVTETIYPNNAITTYSYDPLQVTISRAGQTNVRQSDASGLLHSSSDAGGTISYVYNPEDKIKQITSPSGNTVIGYDDYGYRSSLDDIDAGSMEYEYNAFGELESQTDAKGNEQTLTYDVLGRALTKSWNGGEEITYVYNPVNRMIKSISSSNGTRKRFEYDELNRLQTRVDSIDNNNKFTASYNYLSTGEIGNVVLNSAVTMSYQYNAYGYVDQVRTNNQLVWDANSVNEYGIVNNFTLGNQVNTVISYDQYGFVDGITSTKGGTNLQNWSYDFNNITGNLTSRTGLNSSGNSVTDSFTYDDLNRLLTYTASQDTLSVSYDGSGYGNITGKTDVGTYDYSGGVHNVTAVTNPTVLMQNRPKQHIEYTKFNKVGYIRDSLNTGEERELLITYGPDQQRVKTLYKEDGRDVKTKYFALGQYEKETDSTGNVRELYYVSGADGVVAVLEKKNNQDSIFYIHKDYLGSYEVISNQNGTVKERYNFDPCFVHRSVAKVEGRRRNPADWSYDNVSSSFFIDRGFTGHEHMDQFNMINMNGRVYDPLMAMFLSPDNFVQSPDLTQNLNRYTYCLNNPLKYTDPSGYNYMQLLDMAYEGNPIKNYGGGTWWGNDLQIPYPEDFIGIDGGIYASLSAPGSNYQKWISSPYLQNKYSSFENYNAAQGYYFYVDHGGEISNEKYIINTNGGYIEITLPTINIVTEKIWISTSDTGPSGGFVDGFLHPNITTSEIAPSTIISSEGLLVEATRGISLDQFASAKKFAQKRVIVSSMRIAKTSARSLGVFGAIVTGIEGAFDKDGLTWGDGLKMGIGLATILSYGWVYGAVDLGIGLTTGASITDRLGSGLDNALRIKK